MVRRTPQSLGGPIQISPIATPQDTFVSGPTDSLSQGEIIDFTPFSQVLASYVGQKEREALEDTAETVRAVGQRVESGESLEDVLKDYSQDKSTPTRVKTKLAKLFNENGLDPTANPAYLAQYYTGKGEIRALAARGELLTDKSLADIAQAGKDAPEGEATKAMLGSIKARIEEFSLWEGLGALGQQAIDRQMAGIVGETLRAAEGVYQDQVKADVRETFGGSMLISARRLVENADNPEERTAALQDMGKAYTQLRASGEPLHREILVDSFLAGAEDIAEKWGPEAAADFLKDAVDEFSEGSALVFNGEETADLLNRGKLLSVAASYENDIENAARRKAQARKEAEDLATLQMEETYGETVTRAILQGPAALNAVLDKALEEAAADPTGAQREWVRIERAAGLQQIAARNQDDPNIVNGIKELLSTGQLEAARRTLAEVRRTGGASADTQLLLGADLRQREAVPEAYTPQFNDRVRSRLTEVLSKDKANLIELQDGSFIVDETAVFQQREELFREFQGELSQYLAKDGTSIADGSLMATLEGRIDQFVSRVASKSIPPAKGRTAVKAKEVVSETKVAKEDSSRALAATANKARVESLGGIPRSKLPAYWEQSNKWLEDPKKIRMAGSSLANPFFGGMDGLLAKPESVLTTDGVPLDAATAKRIVTEKLALAQYLDEDILLSGQVPEHLINKFSLPQFEREPGKEKATKITGYRNPALQKYLANESLDVSTLDIYKVPLPKTADLLFNVDTTTRQLKVIKGDEEKIQKVRDLLTLFGKSDADEVVAEFIIHQATLTQALR
jgi:hypothetical protein